MAQEETRAKIMLLTDSYRIVGEMKLGPDGGIWDFKHHPPEGFVTVYGAQFFSVSDGKRMFDAVEAEISRHSVTAIFHQEDLAFVRKEPV